MDNDSKREVKNKTQLLFNENSRPVKLSDLADRKKRNANIFTALNLNVSAPAYMTVGTSSLCAGLTLASGPVAPLIVIGAIMLAVGGVLPSIDMLYISTFRNTKINGDKVINLNSPNLSDEFKQKHGAQVSFYKKTYGDALFEEITDKRSPHVTRMHEADTRHIDAVCDINKIPADVTSYIKEFARIERTPQERSSDFQEAREAKGYSSDQYIKNKVALKELIGNPPSLRQVAQIENQRANNNGNIARL
jgi:hypothetical protein